MKGFQWYCTSEIKQDFLSEYEKILENRGCEIPEFQSPEKLYKGFNN